MCLTAPIFTSARACGYQALARTPSQGTTHHTDGLAGSLGLSCVRGASLEETLGEDSPLATSMPATPATEVQPEDHRNALDRKVLQKTPVLAMARAQTCHRSHKCTKVASEPIYWSFHNLGDISLCKMKVMFYILWYAPGWEDLTAQYIGRDALSCYRSAPSRKRCRGDREAARCTLGQCITLAYKMAAGWREGS